MCNLSEYIEEKAKIETALKFLNPDGSNLPSVAEISQIGPNTLRDAAIAKGMSLT